MKKSLIGIVLACSFFLPACDFLSGEESSSSSSVYVNTYEGEHTDGNDDGLCDDCGENVLVTFDFYAINDLHGKFDDIGAQEGVDELTTYLKRAQARNENTILLSSGDMWQGSAESNLTRGKIITEWMNEMDFVSMTLGNHEYDWGEEYIQSNAELAEFPFLAINVYDEDTKRLAEYCQPSIVLQKSGVKIGVIGAIGDCYSSISGEHNQGFTFKTGAQLTALVKAEANRLRSLGVSYIIYSTHEGFEGYDDALSKEGYVDLVFEGHTHQSYAKKDYSGVFHLQNGGENRGISHANAQINPVTGSSKLVKAEVVAANSYTSFPDDPLVDSLLHKYQAEISKGNEALGTISRTYESSEILSVCARLYLEAGQERWGAQYPNLVLGGGFMQARSPYNLYAGEVRYENLMNILPFDNALVLCSIQGRDLKSKFLYTNNANYYIYCSGYGNSIKNEIKDYETYYLITDTYTSNYASNRLTECARYDNSTFARDLLAEYIKKGGFN